MVSPYPYTRAEECSWQPEEVARHLAALAMSGESSTTDGNNNSNNISNISTQLLSHGWSSRQVPRLRSMFGSNTLPGDRSELLQQQQHSLFRHYVLPLYNILATLAGQLKEPLILMLLASALISVLLGNYADAASIAVALFIVSLVAAIQEYRSEAALEKLANLVPPTCTVLRDGQVMERCLAKDLVIGDLVLLSTGEYVHTIIQRRDDELEVFVIHALVLLLTISFLIMLYLHFLLQSRSCRLSRRRFGRTHVG